MVEPEKYYSNGKKRMSNNMKNKKQYAKFSDDTYYNQQQAEESFASENQYQNKAKPKAFFSEKAEKQ